MNFGFDQADQSNRLGRKNNKFDIASIIIQCTCVCWLVNMVICIMQRRSW